MAAAKPIVETLRLHHLVGGQWVEGDSKAPDSTSSNPAHLSHPLAEYRQADVGLLREALESAQSSQVAWSNMGLIQRGRVLRRAAELLEQRSGEIAAVMTAEEGKTLRESQGEVDAAVETLFYHAASARTASGAVFPSSHPSELIRTIRVPVGVVAVITPWNFPVQIPVWKIAPALLWGNSVVWKPASQTPAVSVLLAEVFNDAGVPAGVLNLLLAPGSIGAALVKSEQVAAITFTGSVPVGRSIAAAAIERGAKIQLELGGHNAAVVLPDVDPATVADSLIAGAMASTGQKCTATRRIIAVGEMYEALIPELRSRIEALRVGDGADESTDIGPMISIAAKDEVQRAVEVAQSEGAEVLARSDLAGLGGAYFAPTLLAGTPDLTICREEVFGPVSTLLAAHDLDEAIGLANATRFGLTSSVFSSNEDSVRRCVQEIDAGLIKANAPTTGSELHVPFGGLKESSFPAPREQNNDTSADFFSWTKSAYLRPGQRWERS